MSNAPISPPPVVVTPPPPRLEEELAPDSGVRRMLVAEELGDRQWMRWGGVFAGLFIALGFGILLSTLGLALGFTTVNPLAMNPGQGLTLGAAIWWGAQSFVVLFLAGFASARLGGAIRRGEGLVDGILAWAVVTVATIWLLGNVSAFLMRGAATAVGAALSTPAGQNMVAQISPQHAAVTATNNAAWASWYSFGVMAVSLLIAMIGGASGALGGKALRTTFIERRAQIRRVA